ncbi:unnamed protein product [Cuscuta europaea]|uniref:Uncharacterized protein n=1 Tax=Cuscuta europaea TaxID=41803 RepID=A0A9P0ZI94_CUSEU|nr:unnamed protein product [Cuscuta europaea]
MESCSFGALYSRHGSYNWNGFYIQKMRKGMPIVIVAGAMAFAFLALMLYTFWAKKRSALFITLVLFPFLICSLLELMVLIGFGFIRVFAHMGSRQLMIYLIFWYLGALVSSGLIIVVINRLSTTSSHDYIEAACSLFIDTIALFFSIFQCSKQNR